MTGEIVNIGTIALAACTFFFVAGTVAAQERMPPIPADKMNPEQKQAVQAIVSGPRGSLPNVFVPLERSPRLLLPLQQVGEYLRFQSKLPGNVREFVILLTARLWTQQYEWNAHYPIALKEGIPKGVIEAIAEGRRPTGMTEEQDAAYNLWSELQQNKSVSDPTYARAVDKFGEQGIVDIVGLAAYYTTLAMFSNTARIPLAPGDKPQLSLFPK